MILFTFSFEKRIQSHPAATPINILHPTEIQTAFIAPGIPVVLINGENANDKSVGAIVLLISEQMPNTPPGLRLLQVLTKLLQELPEYVQLLP